MLLLSGYLCQLWESENNIFTSSSTSTWLKEAVVDVDLKEKCRMVDVNLNEKCRMVDVDQIEKRRIVNVDQEIFHD